MDACFGNKYEVGALPVYPTISGLMVFIWEKENHQDRKYKKCNLLLLISISFSIFAMKTGCDIMIFIWK